MGKFHKIVVPRTAHYYTLGEANKKVKIFWLVCHGMGQNADDFIQSFKCLVDEENFVVAPEGLNKFYCNGFSGNPVASWMTRRHRHDEIADFAHFLHSLYHHFVPQCADDVKIVLLGFSQGCATQVRYIVEKKPIFHALVLCGATIPEDIDYTPDAKYWEGKKIYSICGNNDKFVTPEKIAEQNALMANSTLKIEKSIAFEGKHEIQEESLLELKAILSA